MGFPALQLELAVMCFRRRTEILPIDQFPGTFATHRSSLPALVLRQAHLYIRSRTDVETTIRLTLQNVDAWHVRELVDLLEIEPATFPAGRDARASICSMQWWWTWSGSNRRPLPCHGSALPNCATGPQGRNNSLIVVAQGRQVKRGPGAKKRRRYA